MDKNRREHQDKDCSAKCGGILSLFKTYLDRNRLGELLVVRGVISTTQLREALTQQKETKLPLGEIFIRNSLISRRQLTLVLARQQILRLTAAAVFFVASLTGSTGKKARADIKDVPAQISLTVAANNAFSDMATYPALFETAEKRSGNLKPFTKWTGMFTRFERELNNAQDYQLIREWQKDLAAFQGMNLKRMADRVNDLVNESRYILDNKNWGKSDYWATPVEFLKRGGDCEDFAIAKYTALRTLGVPENRMRVAIVHDKQKNIPHAVLIVYTEQGPYILDNQVKKLVRADKVGRYRPIFSINRTAWWLHTSPTATIVASAQ